MNSPAGAVPTLSAPQATDSCGNHTHQILDQQYRYWRNCITTSEMINIDKIQPTVVAVWTVHRLPRCGRCPTADG